MRTYPAQPLDLMQFINTKYHDPFIHEWIEFEDRLDTLVQFSLSKMRSLSRRALEHDVYGGYSF